MAKYRNKKPAIVEAEQWYPGRCVEGVTIAAALPSDHPIWEIARAMGLLLTDSMSFGWVETLEGGHIVLPGDYIITGIKGERYPCKPDIFKATYEPVEEGESNSA